MWITSYTLALISEFQPCRGEGKSEQQTKRKAIFVNLLKYIYLFCSFLIPFQSTLLSVEYSMAYTYANIATKNDLNFHKNYNNNRRSKKKRTDGKYRKWQIISTQFLSKYLWFLWYIRVTIDQCAKYYNADVKRVRVNASKFFMNDLFLVVVVSLVHQILTRCRFTAALEWIYGSHSIHSRWMFK